MTRPPARRTVGIGHLSLTARITLISVGVALVAALLSGLAAARYVAADERAAARRAVPVTAVGDAVRDRLADRTRLRARRPAVRVRRAVGLSLTIGLLVGLTAGGATARVLTRPLRRTSRAARAMSAGQRDVRVPVEGPPEVAEVAVSLNELADALALSEGRQRRFLLSVSHELRTPLTAVRGYAESIADGVVDGEEAVAAGRVVLAESRRLERLVHDLLDLARLGADDFRLDLTSLDLLTVFEEAVEVWTTRARERRVELRAKRPDPGTTPEPGGARLSARTDASRLRQIVDGLAENAVRMCPAGGSVTLALREPSPEDPPGTRGVIQVRDSGPGLAPEDYAVAFEPGALGHRYRDHRPVGVGIGLSLVHGLVQRLGGGIAVGPAPEGGACFTVIVRDAS